MHVLSVVYIYGIIMTILRISWQGFQHRKDGTCALIVHVRIAVSVIYCIPTIYGPINGPEDQTTELCEVLSQH